MAKSVIILSILSELNNIFIFFANRTHPPDFSESITTCFGCGKESNIFTFSGYQNLQERRYTRQLKVELGVFMNRKYIPKIDAVQSQDGVFEINGAARGMRPFKLKRFFRLVYPPQVRPKILDVDCDVIDLSSKGIRFAYNRRSYQCPEYLAINNSVALRVQFDNGEIADMRVKILRCFEDTELGKTCFAGSIISGMPEQRVSKELVYIQQQFPNFNEQQQRQMVPVP